MKLVSPPIRALGACAVAGFLVVGAVRCGKELTSPAPSPVGAVKVTPGFDHSCGVVSDGSAYCWGSNWSGGLGTGFNNDTASPARVYGDLAFTDIASQHRGWAGNGSGSTCGVATGGAVYCWGDNSNGLLGPAAAIVSRVPVRVAGVDDVRSVTLGAFDACALTRAGSLYCWGYFTSNFGSPVALLGGQTVTSVGAGYGHGCAVVAGGAVYCWGFNMYGELGRPPESDSSGWGQFVPAPVISSEIFSAISAGGTHTCGITTAGAVYCWGSNGSGETGTGTGWTPRPVAGAPALASVSAGVGHTCGLTSGGAAYCWGDNRYGQLGAGSSADSSSIPLPVYGGLTFQSISAGDFCTCAVTTGGAAYCWGDNTWATLGDGTTINRNVPTPVGLVPAAVQVH